MNIKKILLDKDSYKFYLIFAVLVGVFLRFYGLGIQSFWFDEIGTVGLATYPNLKRFFSFLLAADVHPPLYHIFTYYWVKLFGVSEISLRIISAIAGSLALIPAYFISRNVFNKYIASSVTILMALSATAIYYSQEARSYALVLFLSSILTLLWLKMIKKLNSAEISRTELLIYGIIAVITAYTHYFGTALVFFQLIYLIFISFNMRRRIRGFILISFLAAIMFLPWFTLHMMFLKSTFGGSFWIKKQGLSFYIGLINFVFNKYLIWLIFIPFILNKKLFIQNLSQKWEDKEFSSLISALLYLVIVPVIVFSLISLHTPVLIERYFMILLPASYLLMVLMVHLNPDFSEIKGNIYILIFALIGTIIFLFPPDIKNMKINSYYQPHKQDWRQASKYIADNYSDNSVILVTKYPRVYRYYFEKSFKDKSKILINNCNISSYSEDRKIYDKAFFAMEKELDLGTIRQLGKDGFKYNERKFIGGLFIYECTFSKQIQEYH